MLRWIAAKLASKVAGRELNAFLNGVDNPLAVQKRLLKRQLTLLAGSRFANDHHLQHVDTYQDFVRNVPVCRYETIKPYIDELMAGDTSAMFAPSEKLLMFALTSGTTGQPKHIPVTDRFVKDYRRGWNVFGLKALLDHPKAFMRNIMQITSSAREYQTAGGTWCGAITGLLAECQMKIVRKYYITPLAIAEVTDPVAKSYTVARIALPEDVSFTSTANPSTMLRLAKVMGEHTERLIRDVRDGTLNPPGDIAESARAEMAGHLKSKPVEAARLEKLVNDAGALLPKDVWNIEFLTNWTGGTLKLYLSQFDHYFGDIPIRDIGLLASEGRFSIPVEDYTPAGIAEYTSNILEFIPEDDYESDKPETLTLDQVEAGEKYYLIFSNATGLTRYDIGDLVRVVDFYGKTPMFEFLNKGSHISSVTGEKLSERQVVEAVEQLAGKFNTTIENFLVCPHWAETPYYALTLERSAAIADDKVLADEFDAILQQLNIEYQSKRQSLRLGPAKVQRIADGYFNRDDIQHLASTGRSEQYKRKFLLTTPDADKNLIS